MDKIYGFEKLSLVDYPGKIASSIFTGGCNFRCPFCHNSSLVNDFNNLQSFSFEEIMNYLKKRKGIIEAVCVSGGEPTLTRNLREKLLEIKKEGFLVKIDTNGTNKKLVSEFVENNLIDYVAMDIKNCLPRYFETSGVNNIDLSKITEMIDYLKENHIDYEFRTTLVKEFHTEEDIIEMGKLLANGKVLYLQRFIDRDTCIMNGLSEVDIATALKYKTILQKYLNKVELRGY